MQNFLAALKFITIFPAGGSKSFKPRQMAAYFPVVGLLLGTVLLVLDWFLLKLYPLAAASVLEIVILLVMTGAFHLDGLADSADGLFSHQGRKRALEIMKDSRIGVMGAGAVVSVLALKCSGLLAIEHHRSLCLLLVPAYSRLGMLLGMRLLPYGRPEGGTGAGFFEKKHDFRLFFSFPLLLGLSLFLGWGALALNLGFLLCSLLILYFYQKRLASITGDTLGAMNESLEACLFLILGAWA